MQDKNRRKNIMRNVGVNPFNRAKFTSQKTKSSIEDRGSDNVNKFDEENNSALKTKVYKKV